MLDKRRCLIFLAICIVNVHAQNNVTQHEYEQELKTKFNCKPFNYWDLVKYNEKVISDVCMERDYRSNDPPNRNNVTKVLYYFFSNTKLFEVDERAKTITMDITMILSWEDSRIKAKFVPDENDSISLPPLRKDREPYFWTPIHEPLIFRIKEKKYLVDPIDN